MTAIAAAPTRTSTVVPPAVEADPALQAFVSDLSAEAAQAAFLGLAECIARSPAKAFAILSRDLQADFVLRGCDHVENVRLALESLALDAATINEAALYAARSYQANVETLVLSSHAGGAA